MWRLRTLAEGAFGERTAELLKGEATLRAAQEEGGTAGLRTLESAQRLSDQYWENEIKGSNSFIQRAKRLVIRVPHYKTGEEQAAEVQAAGKLGS